MKLCIVASDNFFSNYGGGQIYVRNIVDELIRQKEAYGIDLSVLSISTTLFHSSETKKYKGIEIVETYPNGNIETILKSINPEIVHAHGEKLLVSKICNKLGIPCIVTAHHGGIVCPAGALLNTKDEICSITADYNHCLKCYLRNTPTGLFWYPLLKRFCQPHFNRIGQRLKRLPFIPFLSPIGETGLIVSQKLNEWQELSEIATHFIAPSYAIAEALQRNCCPKSKITVIPHGIPILEKEKPGIFNSQVSTLKFYYVGRINYIKGLHIMLKAFSEIDNSSVELHIIGDAGNNTELRYMKQLKRKYRKDSRIIWHGKLNHEQMMETISGFHCLVHPTMCLEVFGLNISEALSQQKYVIATRCGGAEMQIHNENNGSLVEPNNVQALKNEMLSFIANPKPSNSSVIDIETHVQTLYHIYSKTITESNQC